MTETKSKPLPQTAYQDYEDRDLNNTGEKDNLSNSTSSIVVISTRNNVIPMASRTQPLT